MWHTVDTLFGVCAFVAEGVMVTGDEKLCIMVIMAADLELLLSLVTCTEWAFLPSSHQLHVVLSYPPEVACVHACAAVCA